jgi:outer membrane protein assembly factor BamB
VPTFLALLVPFLFTTLAIAGDWPMWRGAHLDGVSRESTLYPVHWSATENIHWKAEIPGVGHSSPVVVGDRIFVTSCVENKDKNADRLLICLSRSDGKILWQQKVLSCPLERKHKLNSYASSTPATDGKYVYVTFLNPPKIIVDCYTVDGKYKWRSCAGEFNSPHGFCSSPILYKDLVIVNCDQDNQEAFIVAYNKIDGDEKYRIDRPNRTRSYCVPLIVEAAGKTQMVLTGSKCVASYDPGNGKQLWLIDGPTEQFVASAVYTDDMFIITGGYPDHHILGIKPDGEGNVTNSHIKWRTTRNTSYVPSPIAYRGLFYIVSDEGFASCYEPTSGKMLWNERLCKHTSASLTAAGDYVYFLDDFGTTYVVKAGRALEVVAKNALKEECYASPALSNGQIFIRAAQHLYCIANKAKRNHETPERHEKKN